jgi:hypothetical protein
LDVEFEKLQNAEKKLGKKQVCNRPMESQREMSRTLTAVRSTQVTYDRCKAANDLTPTGQAALTAAELALQTAIAAKNAADKSYTAAKQNAEKEAKKKQQQEAKRKQRAADAEVAGDVAAGVVAAYYAVPEFQGRANKNTTAGRRPRKNSRNIAKPKWAGEPTIRRSSAERFSRRRGSSTSTQYANSHKPSLDKKPQT